MVIHGKNPCFAGGGGVGVGAGNPEPIQDTPGEAERRGVCVLSLQKCLLQLRRLPRFLCRHGVAAGPHSRLANSSSQPLVVLTGSSSQLYYFECYCKS